MEPLPVCLAIVGLFILCGFFTVMSVSLDNISLSLLQKDTENPRCRSLLKLKENETAFLSVCRFWTTLLLLSAGAVGAAGFSHAGPLYAALIVLAAAFAGIVIVWLAPLRVALKNAEPIARALAPFMRAVHLVTSPAVAAAQWLARLLAVIGGVAPDEELSDITEEEIRLMVDIGSENGAIAPEEKEFIENIFEFDTMSAADVMTHRTDVAVLKLEDDPREWEKIVRDTGFSRFPVCGGKIDNIVGVVHARELYEFLYDGSGKAADITRPTWCRKPFRRTFFSAICRRRKTTWPSWPTNTGASAAL